jgi:hypothetical protein
VAQGCQIFLGTIYQYEKKIVKRPQNIPHGHTKRQITTKKNGREIYINTKILYSTVFKNITKLVFLVQKNHLATLL